MRPSPVSSCRPSPTRSHEVGCHPAASRTSVIPPSLRKVAVDCTVVSPTWAGPLVLVLQLRSRKDAAERPRVIRELIGTVTSITGKRLVTEYSDVPPAETI